MDLHIFLLLILLIGNVRADERSTAIDIWRYGGPYGVYCGIFHSSKTFDMPINAVDRACQLHDTCISAAGRYLSCECNEQLHRRMSEVCPSDATAAYYRDEIIKAMNIGTSLCGSATCNLMNRYDVSHELGYNAIPFYGPVNITITETEGSLLIGMIPTSAIETFGILNLAGKAPISDFKKDVIGTFSVPENETLILFNPLNSATVFYALQSQ